MDKLTAVRWTAEEALAMDVWLVEERGFTIPELMAVAGLRVAEAALAMCRERGLGRVVLLVGPGNNGGDAVVAAGHLREAGLEVVETRPLAGDGMPSLDAETLVVDGLFGVGLSRAIDGAAREAVEAVNASDAAVLSIDVPSGLSATTGQVVGATASDPEGGVVVRPDLVLTFVGPKAGFFVGRGPEVVREWEAVDIGFPVVEAETWIAERRRARD